MIDNFIQSRWYTGRSITEKEILQTAGVIASTHWEMEMELEMMDQRIWQGDVHKSTLARYIGVMTDTQKLFTSDVGIFKEIEEMEQNVPWLDTSG